MLYTADDKNAAISGFTKVHAGQGAKIQDNPEKSGRVGKYDSA